MKCIAPRCPDGRELGALFCKGHLAAPTGTRGGWISAWRRAQARGGAATPLDASNVARRLWVGSVPPFDRDLPGFDVLVLCAIEHQPTQLAFSRQVIRVPLHDVTPLNAYELKRALIGGKQVGEQLARGRRVLVTCNAGLNRSAFVAGLGLGVTTRMTSTQIIDLIRQRRAPAALGNPFFCEVMYRVIGRSNRGR